MQVDSLSPFLLEPLKVERLTLAIRDLPPSFKPIKLVQLSDFHYDGTHLSDPLLSQVIEKTNAETPDLIVLTGDYITYLPQSIWDLVSHLKYLESSLGIYATLGNHDLYHPLAKDMVIEALTSIGIKVLWNEIATPLGDQFPMIGLADYWSKAFNPHPIFSQLDPCLPRLVLSHNPDTADILKQWRVDLQLSGHTHGGQVTIPGLGSIPTLINQIRPYIPSFLHDYIPLWKACAYVVKNWQWSEGLHPIGNNLLYVNRGLGSYFPGRLFCPPELTVITLVPR